MDFTNVEQAITNEDITTFEQSTGLTLPNDYKNFLLENNGGTSSDSVYVNDDTEYMVASFYSITHGRFTVESSLTALIGKQGFRPTFIPFADDPFGNRYCIDSDDGKVYLWEHDLESEAELLEQSFSDFIDQLTDEDEEYEF